MKYDFDTIVLRRGTNSYKWDTPKEKNVLPMWVADMDFRTHPHCRSLTKAGCTRYFRLYQSTRNLLRCGRPVVREPSSLADRSPVDYLYKRCRTGSVGHYQSPDRTGR